MNTEKEFEELTMFLEQIKNEVDFSECKDFDDRMIFSILFCIKRAKQIEREACAKVVEASPSYDWHRFACEAAAAIRARGQA